MNNIISIIVPIYNVEKYLKKCIDSIRNQTYTHLEIILVDDGSPDNCPKICDEYARIDPRIKVIHKKNGGLSDARNAGIEIMEGEYVAFIDSDDWLDPDWCELLQHTLVEHNADMCLSGIVREFEAKENTAPVLVTDDYGDMPFCESNVDMMRRFLRTSWVAWDKLYRAELFKNLRFPINEINEDEAIALKLLDITKRVAITNKSFYHYLERQNSITTTTFSEKKLAWARHCRDNLEFVREKYPELEKDALARYRSSLVWSLREIALSERDFSDTALQFKTELRKSRKDFSSSGFRNKQEQRSYLLAQYVPFCIYRKILNLRHRQGIR